MAFRNLRKIANAEGGIRQVNLAHFQDGRGSVSVRLSSGVILRASAKDYSALRQKVMRWKRAQGLPCCINGSPKGFVSKDRA